MKRATRIAFLAGTILLIAGIGLFWGCNDNSTAPPAPTPPSNDFSIDVLSPTVTAGGATTLNITGGNPPYAVDLSTLDTTVAKVTLSGNTIHVTGVSGGFTYVVVNDSAVTTSGTPDSSRLRVAVTVSGAIHADLFPLLAGRYYSYTGFLVEVNTVATPKAGSYSASWTVAPVGGTTWLIQDSTTYNSHLTTRGFLIRKNVSGDFDFLQTLGPFYRAFSVPFTDSTAWIHIAKPSLGITGTPNTAQWTAFDTTVTGTIGGTSGLVRLQILASLSGAIITDSTAGHNTYASYYVRTWRKITLGSIVVQDDATTARLWLVKDIGPVQVNIAGDTENYGHFRILQSKNF
jgi:hypothetical protein